MNDPRTPDDPLASAATGDGSPDDRVTPSSRADSRSLPVIGESIHVEKVAVDRGGYRITKHVEAHDVTVDESLRHETVAIERRPVNRQLAEDEVPVVRHEGDTTIVPVVKEIVVTQKRLVLVEEIRIVRIGGTHRDPQSVTVREEHIEIERLGAGTSVIRSS